jgi:hypothetical protein
MKKSLFICTVCAAVLATACCGGKNTVTAIVAGPDKVAALVVEYSQALDAESVCPEAFVVEGEEVVAAKLVEPTKVLVALKKDCCGKKHECGEAKPECGQKPECCEKKEAPKCEEGKPCPADGEAKPECGEAKPCPKEAAEKDCCKEKCEIPVPEVAVQQVVDLKTAEGKTVKAWKKAVKATEACPAPHHGKHHGKPGCGEKPECGQQHECGAQPCDKPAEEQCDKCKEAAAK